MENKSGRVCLLGLLPEELQKYLPDFKSFKVREVFKNISRSLFSFEDYTTLTYTERSFLTENFFCTSATILEHQKDADGTQKISIQIDGGHIIEAVLLVDKDNRKTACISSQVGCPLACQFCKTGLLGFARNLSTAEILEQFFLLERIAGTIDNIVFMGMGEPLLNFDAVKKSILILSHPQGRHFSKRRITISTSGIISGIVRLGTELPEIRLAVSLTTANEKLRRMLMPVTLKNPLHKLKEALFDFTKQGKRRITLEVALMHGINTDKQACAELIEFVRPLNAHVNLIAWNPIPELAFLPPTEKEVQFVYRELQTAHINVTKRKKHGGDISGACGQLGKVHV